MISGGARRFAAYPPRLALLDALGPAPAPEPTPGPVLGLAIPPVAVVGLELGSGYLPPHPPGILPSGVDLTPAAAPAAADADVGLPVRRYEEGKTIWDEFTAPDPTSRSSSAELVMELIGAGARAR